MNLLEKAQAAFALIEEGRTALAGIASAVRDGSAAINAPDKAELDRMLEAEGPQTRAVYQGLKDAIAQSRQ